MSQMNKILSSGDSEVISYICPLLEKNVFGILYVTMNENNIKMFEKLIRMITNIETDHIKNMMICAIQCGQHEILEIIMREMNIANINTSFTWIKHITNICNFDEKHMKCLILLIKAGYPFHDCSTKYILILKLVDSLLKGNKIDIFDEKINVSLPTEEEFKEYIASYQEKPPLVDIMFDVIQKNDERMFHRFLEVYQMVNRLDTVNESTPIMHAAQHGRHRMVKFLLEKGAHITESPINKTHILSRMKSALHYAVNGRIDFSEGHIECIKLLLKAGANTDILKQDSMLDYYLIEFIRERIPIDSAPLKLFNKSGVEYVVIKPEPEPVTSSEKLLIEVLSKSESKTSEIYKIGKLFGSDHVVKLFDGSATECTISNKENIEIEIPKYGGSYHLLPIGIYLNDIKLTKPTVCRFVTGNVATNEKIASILSIPEMY